MAQYVTKNAEQTAELGKKLAQTLEMGDVVALCGGLGAGKTVFAKGIAQGLGVEDEVTSPTFTLLRLYQGRLPLCHFDLYRIEDETELEHIGFYDYAGGDNVCVIEWAQNAQALRPSITVELCGAGSDERRINITGANDAFTGS